ncbi:MAG: endonuclease/exonuclease/phosphatase family protein [Flavobacteriales bacterium]|nr:endonuclease/exonuclease/phosphatase family protein [Flavobacteriales bacterium]
MNKYRFIDKLLLPLTWLSVGVLLVSYLAWYLTPSQFILASFAALAYPILLLLLLLWLLFWLFRFKRILLIPILGLAAGWGHFTAFFPWGGATALTANKDALRVLSLNSRHFDQSYWGPDYDLLGTIDSFFRAEQAHVIALQEFNKGRKVDLLASQEYSRLNGKSNLALFTNLPVVRTDSEVFPKHINYGANGFQWADLLYGGDTLRVYNCHVSSNQLEHSQVELIEKVEEITTEKINTRFGAMYKLLKTGFLYREKQIEVLKTHIDGSPYPVLVVGDFNDTPLSSAYREMARELVDGYREHGRGWGKTYRKSLIPLRIDYHFHDPMLRTQFVGVRKVDISDHYPLVGHYTWE